MAVLPASKAYPRGGAPRRQYVKGAPLVARFAMKFGGVDYPRGAELPIEQMSPHKHWELWQCGKADHALNGPFNSPPPPLVAPSESIPVTVQSQEEAAVVVPEVTIAFPGVTTQSISDAELDRLTAPTTDTNASADPPKVERRGRRS